MLGYSHYEKKEEDNKIQIFINKKEMPYSHQNMARAINSFLPYLTNNDLTELEQDILDLFNHREKKKTRVVMGVCFGERDDTTEDGWENEGGVTLPEVDDNSPREELDNWKERYKGYKEHRNEKDL